MPCACFLIQLHPPCRPLMGGSGISCTPAYTPQSCHSRQRTWIWHWRLYTAVEWTCFLLPPWARSSVAHSWQPLFLDYGSGWVHFLVLPKMCFSFLYLYSCWLISERKIRPRDSFNSFSWTESSRLLLNVSSVFWNSDELLAADIQRCFICCGQRIFPSFFVKNNSAYILTSSPCNLFKCEMSMKEDLRSEGRRSHTGKCGTRSFKIHFHLTVNSGYWKLCLQKSNLPFKDPHLEKLKNCLDFPSVVLHSPIQLLPLPPALSWSSPLIERNALLHRIINTETRNWMKQSNKELFSVTNLLATRLSWGTGTN